MSKKQRQAHVYEHHKGDTFASPVDKRKCRASVSDREGWHSHQCARKVKVEVGGYGWCQQHCPAAIAERDQKRDAGHAKRQRKWAAETVGRAFLNGLEQGGAALALEWATKAWEDWDRPK